MDYYKIINSTYFKFNCRFISIISYIRGKYIEIKFISRHTLNQIILINYL